MNVSCPTCSKNVEWSNRATFRPFCSKRCQMIDLGDWAEEQHTIPGKPTLDPSDMSDDELAAFIKTFDKQA